jgi:hypothetical protein
MEREMLQVFLCTYPISALATSICHTADVRIIIHFRAYPQQQDWHCFAGHQDRPSYHHAMFPYGNMLRSLPPLPKDLPELWRRSIAVISEICRDMLQRVWAEMDYRLDVCSVTNADTYSAHEVSEIKTWIFSVSICRSITAIIPAIEVYRFYEIFQGVMNSYVCMYLRLSV